MLVGIGIDEPESHPARSGRDLRSRRDRLFLDAHHLGAHLDRPHSGSRRNLEGDLGPELEADRGIEEDASRAEVSRNLSVRLVRPTEVTKLDVELNGKSRRPAAISA